MSNRKRARRPTRQRAGAPPAAWRADNIAGACKSLLDDPVAKGRLLLADSPALGRTGTTLRRGTTAGSVPLPVALVEPRRTARTMTVQGLPPGYLHDLRVGIAVKLGLALLTAPASPPAAANWVLRRAGELLILADPTGASLAEFTIPDEPEWLAAAGQHGEVIVIYGPQIGVRRPASVPHGGYDDHARAAELDEFIGHRMVAWGRVSFSS